MQRSSSLIRALGQLRTCRKACRSITIRSLATKCPKQVLNARFSKLSLTGRYWVLSTASNGQLRHYSSDFPEHYRVNLPALSPTMEVGTIVRWSKEEGDQLSEGDLLAEIETDKATMGFETPEEGYLAKILVTEGTKDVKIGTLVCVIVPDESSVPLFKEFVATDESPAVAQVSVSASSPQASNYPQHTPCKMPSLSPTMERGNLLEWQKSVGDELVEGDVLARIETDKSTLEWESPEEGFLAKILVPAETKQIPVGQIICVVVPNKEDIAAFNDYEPPVDKPVVAAPTPVAAPPPPPIRTAPLPVAPALSAAPLAAPTRASGQRVFSTPLARATAMERGIDITLVPGSGPEGQVRVDDVKNYVPAAAPAAQPAAAAAAALPPPPPPAAGAYTDIPVTGMRKVIAERLLLSKQTIPHYYLSVDVNMDSVLKLRSELNSMLKKEEIKLSVNDFIIKASALSLKKIPEANSSWQDTFIRQHHSSDISIAVATDRGLITPIVFQADRKGLASINQDVSSLAERARENQLQPHEFQGGTFTISNLGMFGIKNFSAVINPPQSCILAVGGAENRLLPDEDAEKGYRTASMMSVTLSCDHRVVDGAVGAQWLAEFKRFLEKPHTMLL